MPDRGFARPYGSRAGGKVVDAQASLADGDTVDVGLQTIDNAIVQVRSINAGTDDLAVGGYDEAATTAPDLQIWLATPDGTATGAAETDARACTVVAFGE